MPKLSLQRNSDGTILPIVGKDKKVHAFLKGISR